jgi:hypothetical protein
MVRISKQEERRKVSFRRPRSPALKTGPVKEKLPLGYKAHVNAVEGDLATKMFVPKIR